MIERSIVLLSKELVERACTVLRGLPLNVKPPFEVVVRPHGRKRTPEQNKRYHKIVQEIADQLWIEGKQYGVETLKEWFKREFIGTEELIFPDGRVEIRGISTTTLKVGEFANFMTQIEHWATENGVIFDETRAMLDAYEDEARRWRKREQKKMF